MGRLLYPTAGRVLVPPPLRKGTRRRRKMKEKANLFRTLLVLPVVLVAVAVLKAAS
jgi:hypothetical protein